MLEQVGSLSGGFGDLWGHFGRPFSQSGVPEGAREAKLELQNRLPEKHRQLKGRGCSREGPELSTVVHGGGVGAAGLRGGSPSDSDPGGFWSWFSMANIME